MQQRFAPLLHTGIKFGTHELACLEHLWVCRPWCLPAQDLHCCDLLHFCAWSDEEATLHAETLQPAGTANLLQTDIIAPDYSQG